MGRVQGDSGEGTGGWCGGYRGQRGGFSGEGIVRRGQAIIY